MPAGAFPPLPVVMAIMLLQGALYMYRAITLDARNTKDLIARFLDKKEISDFREKMHQDVRKEAQDVDSTDPKSIALQINQLRKVYPKKGKTPRTVAVTSASMQVRKREILCLLGPNGAGKSTTLNMLLRSCNPTRGDAFILGHSVLNDFEAGAISLGVVPQDNNLWPLLSCKQHLQLFAELRGVRSVRARQYDIFHVSLIYIWHLENQRSNTGTSQESTRYFGFRIETHGTSGEVRHALKSSLGWYAKTFVYSHRFDRRT